MSLLSSSDWRRIKLFDAPQSTRARSDIPLVTLIFKVMRDSSSLSAVTHSDCVLGATFVKSPANSLDVAGSVGRSAPTDPVRFLTVRLVVATLRHCRTRALDLCSANGGHHVLSLDVVHYSGHYTRKRSVRSSDSDGILPIACGCSESEVSRSLPDRVPLVRNLRFSVVLVDDR